jgi:phosphatidylserine decarboxylase
MDSATARTAARILRLIPRERITRALGHLTDARVPQAVLNPVLKIYSRAYNVDMSEAVEPAEGFATFNEFFTRRLRDGLRPIDPDPDVIISPSDGRLDDAGDIDEGRTFVVKGQRYDAAELLGSASDAEQYAGGRYVVVYLSPRDYHRVHSPADGRIHKVRHLPGTLFPVNEFGVKHVPLLFAKNERVAMFLETEQYGSIAVVMVGAMVVGRITLSFDGPPRPSLNGPVVERWYDEETLPAIRKGDELGAFQLGSTVVLLLPPPRRGRDSIAPGVVGTHVRLGQAIVRRSEG